MLSHPTPSVSVSFSPLLSTRQPYSCAHQHQWWSQQTMPGPVYYLPLPLRSASCGLLGSEPPSNLQTTTASSPRTESWEISGIIMDSDYFGCDMKYGMWIQHKDIVVLFTGFTIKVWTFENIILSDSCVGPRAGFLMSRIFIS